MNVNLPSKNYLILVPLFDGYWRLQLKSISGSDILTVSA